MNQHLHQLAVDIFHTAKENNIEIEAEWIPRSLNEKADYLSKIVDCDNCFASYKNHKVLRFFSKFFNFSSLGVDSLAYSWVGETC